MVNPVKKLLLDEKEYGVDQLSEDGIKYISLLQFATDRLKELGDNKILLARARESYINSLRQEILSAKAGFLVEDN